MDELLLNPRTAAGIERYLNKPAHALLLCGPGGSGKLTLARYIATRLLGITNDKLDGYAHFWIIGLPEGKKDIPIEAVRSITRSLRLQVPGQANVRRVIVIENAQAMNQEAQNAFLKSLEEPGEATVFILTASATSALLPTIVSRTTAVNVEPVSLDSALAHFKDNSAEQVRSAWSLSRGSAGLLAQLLENGQGSELKQAVDKAKAFVRLKPYERLLELESLKDKRDLADFLDGLSRVLQALYRAAAGRHDAKSTKTLLDSAKTVFEAQEALSANVLPRLVVLKLILGLSI